MSTPLTARVLVVDDHPAFAHGLSAILDAEADLDVIGIAPDAAAAVALATTARPDVVLMDYRLPDLDGVAASRALRSSAPGVAVILLTGMDDDDIVLRALEAGCVGFLSKRDEIPKIVEAVRAARAGELSASPDDLAHLTHRMAGTDRRHMQLTAREREVLALMGEGLTNAEIAEHLFLAVNTVRNYVARILATLGAHSKLEAVVIAARRGLLPER